MTPTRERVESWIRAHRLRLLVAWALIGAVVLGAIALHRGDFWIRGAPLSKWWAALIFATAWVWLALRVIWLWIWAWIVLAFAPVWLYIVMRPYLEAPWLLPFLGVLAAVSAVVVATVVWIYRPPAFRSKLQDPPPRQST